VLDLPFQTIGGVLLYNVVRNLGLKRRLAVGDIVRRGGAFDMCGDGRSVVLLPLHWGLSICFLGQNLLGLNIWLMGRSVLLLLGSPRGREDVCVYLHRDAEILCHAGEDRSTLEIGLIQSATAIA
jgi:hypothetical protein